MLNDPERLRQFSDTYLGLKSTAPSQYTSLADLGSRLPAPQAERRPAHGVTTTGAGARIETGAPAAAGRGRAAGRRAAGVPLPPIPVAPLPLARRASSRGQNPAAASGRRMPGLARRPTPGIRCGRR